MVSIVNLQKALFHGFRAFRVRFPGEIIKETNAFSSVILYIRPKSCDDVNFTFRSTKKIDASKFQATSWDGAPEVHRVQSLRAELFNGRRHHPQHRDL